MNKKLGSRLAVLMAMMGGAGSVGVAADPYPLWEVGAGAAALRIADYRGSDEMRNYAAPIPYVVYRGEFLKVDRQKIRGLFYHNQYGELDFSLNGSVPVDSDKNRARQGMPDLDPTLELGPAVNLFLYRSADHSTSLELRLPTRAVIAGNFRHQHRVGSLFQPNINLDFRPQIGGHEWKVGLQLGALIGDRRYFEYMYGVQPVYATADRPAYEARGGYGGLQAIAAVSRRFKDFWVGAYVKSDHLRGAVFEDSPLVKRKNSLSGGIGFAWVFGRSGRMVEADE